MKSISFEVKKDYKSMFEEFDCGDKGFLTNNEMKALLEEKGYNVFRRDLNRFDTIKFDDFCEIMDRKEKEKKFKEDLFQAFVIFDKEKTGALRVDVFRRLMLSLEEKLTQKEVEEMIIEAEPDENGYIDYKNFIEKVLDDD